MAGFLSSRHRLLTVGVVVLLALALAGCRSLPFAADAPEIPMTTVYPTSPEGVEIQNLYNLIFWLSVFVFVAVNAVMFYAIYRFRARPGDRLPEQTHGNNRLEIAWTIAPAVVLAIMGVPTITTIFRAAAPPPANALKVSVVGHQWWWEFQYPDLNITTANEVHVVAGRTTSFELTSADIIHSFWFPKWTGKLDVVPNHLNVLNVTPEVPGVYYGQCVEFCGTQHANMKMRAVVHANQAEFDAWARSQQAPAVAATQATQAGAQIATTTCAACHTIGGTTAAGKIGPDLTHFGSRLTVAAGMLDNTPENLARWIQDPQAVKPGNKMPNLNLTEQQVADVTAYLLSLK